MDSTPSQDRARTAISMLQNREVATYREAELECKVPRSTIHGRKHGRKTKAESAAERQKLTPLEERSLIEHIQRLHAAGYPPKRSAVREMANTLIRCRKGSSSVELSRDEEVGQHWAGVFYKRHPELMALSSAAAIKRARLLKATEATQMSSQRRSKQDSTDHADGTSRDNQADVAHEGALKGMTGVVRHEAKVFVASLAAESWTSEVDVSLGDFHMTPDLTFRPPDPNA